MHICISTEQIRSKNLGIRSSKCFQTLCLAMAVNHFWLFPPNCFDAIVCYMGSCISPMDSPPNKWAHEQHNILHLMCNNTAEQPVKKQNKKPNTLYIFTSHMLLVLLWHILQLYSLPLIYLSLYICSINNIWQVRNISWPCQWKISINFRRFHHLELICMT